MTTADTRIYAHTKAGASSEEWHLLVEHLQSVADRAAQYAAPFGASRLGYYSGLWHDLGKFAPDWQQFLRDAGEDASELGEDTPVDRRVERKRGPDHSTAGAVHAARMFGKTWHGRALSLVIASHHAGLPDPDSLDRRLLDDAKVARYAMAVDQAPLDLLGLEQSAALPDFFVSADPKQKQMRRYELFVRMLFSALVDADFLDTEAFMDTTGRQAARSGWPQIAAYANPLREYLDRLREHSTSSQRVRNARNEVLQWSLDASHDSPGAFTLTVPTGGGKTLAALAFAIDHAVAHGLDRVIVALPFLSILDQTASVLRGVFEPALGERVLVEHHSNLTLEKDTQRNKLAAENWDAPLVVTTQVQLFESLFARRTSACRKLHSLANSVVILDEVQTLPVGLVDPILDVLQELRRNYRTTLLLTTATQPSLQSRPLGASRFQGIDPAPKEIVPADRIESLFDSLRRVDVSWPADGPPKAWNELADEVAAHERVLTIVHRRADAAELWRLLNERVPGTIHLSALMCPAHRRRVLDQVRRQLQSNAVCRVVSTQLVEAGVDVDFPVVFRAMAGLESLAQSAGRCNREGKLERGLFNVFHAPTQPVGSLKHHKELAETMLRANPDLDLFAPGTFRSYFDRLYAERDRDVHGVQVSRQSLRFEETGDRFHMIDSSTTPVFVPYDREAMAAITTLRIAGPSRERLRFLQSYAVNVYPDALRRMQERGSVELIADAAWALISLSGYDPDLGLLVEGEDSSKFVI